MLNGKRGRNRRSLSFCPTNASHNAQDFLERFSELGIENRVNNGIDDAVHVTEPRGQHEGGCAETTVRLLKLDTYSVDDVAREEGHPADQEDA